MAFVLPVAAAAAVAAGAAYVTQRPEEQHARKVLPVDPDSLSPVPAKGQHSNVDPRVHLPIRYAKKGAAARVLPPICEAFKTVANGPLRNHAAFKIESKPYNADKAENWQVITWEQYYNNTRRFAKALLSIGMQQADGVAIIGFNDPCWLTAHMGAVMVGGLSAGTYPTNSPELCKYVANDSRSIVAVCDTMANANKYISKKKEMPQLKHIIVYTDSVPNEHAEAQSGFLLSYNDFVARGDSVSDKDLDERMSTITPSTPCSLIYTSGTTGDPKGVLLTNDGCMFTCFTGLNGVGVPRDVPEHRSVSYLPPSHIAAQLLDVYMPLFFMFEGIRWTVYFARPDVMKGSLKTTLLGVRPTLFFGVPRVWEKFTEGIKAKAKEAPATGLKKQLIDWAKSVGLSNSFARQIGGDGIMCRGSHIAEKLVFSKVKAALGLDQCVRFYTGAAPTQRATMEFLAAIGIDLQEVFGMSESAGLFTASSPACFKFGFTGQSMEGVEVKLDHDASRGDKPGHGEICARGRNIMQCYLGNQQKTDEAIDPEGWLHSGDLGYFENGLLKISGRIKNLIITAGGENIPSGLIEEDLQKHLPAVSAAVAIGDGKKYLTCLFSLKQKPTEDGGFIDELIGEAKEVNPQITTAAAAANDAKWKAYLEAGIKKYNTENAVSNAQKIQKFRIVPLDFSIAAGELTPTLKLKRNVVVEKYSSLVETMYEE